MTTGSFLTEMLMLYSIALLGFTARKTAVLNENTNEVLTQLILYITLPSLILFSLDIPFSISILKEFLWLISMSAYIMLLSCLLAGLMRRRAQLPSKQKHVYESLIIFGNQGFIGYAVCFILFQEQGIIYLTIFNLWYLLLIWSYGIYLFTKTNKGINWKHVFLNPGILSTLLGLVVLFSPLSWPSAISETLQEIGKMTIPLSMILIGSLMANIQINVFPAMVRNSYLWKSVAVRLVIIPSLLFPFITMPVPDVLLIIAILVSGMPSAPTISLYSQKFGADTSFATSGVLLTTLLCIFTIPLIYFVLTCILTLI
ncbi:AEC family transporter [Virgibacillus siamensis]|uniref:AEC family transporter n=1 Tax=Virgibacillus siamensis TaxID=480071 RepID=A0ABP3QXF8_9BACI